MLLGLRSFIIAEYNTTPAEMTYGETLRLPDDFFSENKLDHNIPTFLFNLREYMQKLQPIEAKHNCANKIFIHPKMNKTAHVFLRHDASRKPLQSVYDGPLKVIERFDKYFDISTNRGKQRVSIDRLKPAFILNEIENSEEGCSSLQKVVHPMTIESDEANKGTTDDRIVEEPSIKTPSGWKVRFPS